MFLTANILFVRREGAVEFAWTLILKKVSNQHFVGLARHIRERYEKYDNSINDTGGSEGITD